MSLYFVLNTDEYSGDEAEIGSIIDRINKILYQSSKMRLCLYRGPTTEELTAYFKSNNMDILLEEILWKNMTDEEKKAKFLEYVAQIGGIESNLLIIDPYIFAKNSPDDYKALLTSILIGTNFASLTIITEKKHFDSAFFSEVKTELKKEISIEFSDDYHDRYWLANGTKGFLIGSSLNGIGKKYSTISIMDEQDVLSIVNIVNSSESKD